MYLGPSHKGGPFLNLYMFGGLFPVLIKIRIKIDSKCIVSLIFYREKYHFLFELLSYVNVSFRYHRKKISSRMEIHKQHSGSLTLITGPKNNLFLPQHES